MNNIFSRIPAKNFMRNNFSEDSADNKRTDNSTGNMIRTKLRTSSGFSLTELLTAILILSLTTAAVTAGISASLRVYNDSVIYSEERMLLSTLCEAVTGELRYATEIKSDTEGNITTFTSPNYGSGVSFGFKQIDSAPEGWGIITIGVSSKAYLIGSGSYSNNKIGAKINTLEVSDDKIEVEIQVCTLASETSRSSPESRTFTICPLIPIETTETDSTAA